MQEISVEKVNSIIKSRIEALRCDYELLKSAERLIGSDVALGKKRELLDIISELQDLQHKVLDCA